MRQNNLIKRLILVLGTSFVFMFTSNAFSAINSDTIRPLPQINKKFLVVLNIALDYKGKTNVLLPSIQAEIAKLNQIWAPIGASFEICDIVYIPNVRYDSLINDNRFEEFVSQYGKDERINIYFSTDLVSNGISLVGKVTGSGISQPKKSAIWINKDIISFLPRLMGYYWGLKDTYYNLVTENPDNSNCSTAGDYVCDTPIDPYFVLAGNINEYVDQNCVYINKKKDANGNYYNPDVYNIMSDYGILGSCGACSKFTNGQYKKMYETYLINTTKW